MFEAVTPTPPCTPGRSPRSEPRWSLLVAILGSTMAFVDGTVVNVALPVMQRELAASIVQMQWIVEAYALLLASLVLVGGALGDRLGRRRVFVAGALVFAGASACCGLAPSSTWLIVARGVQGAGGALLVPGSLALIGAAYPEDSRGRAIGTWSAATAVAGALGPVLGGWVVAHASWRWLFFFNVPVAAAVVGVSTTRVTETRDDQAPAGVDVAGAALAVTGLGAIVWGLLEAPSAGGLGSAQALVPLLGGTTALAAFVVVEARVRAPMVPLSLFRSRTFAGTNLATLLLYAALGGCLFFVPFDLIQVQRYSPAAAGAALLPFVVLVSALSRWAGGLGVRYGARTPLVVGPLVTAAGFVLLGLPSASSIGRPYLTTFFPGIAVLGLGMGVTVAPLTTTVMGAVEQRHAGVASGINNAVARAAGLLAVAALGVVLVARYEHELTRELDLLALSPSARAFVDAGRSKLAGADLPPGVAPVTRVAIAAAFDRAFVAGFRALMLAGAALATLAAGVSFALVDRVPHALPSERSSR